MAAREKWIARNISTGSLSLGKELPFIPFLKTGDQVDLLLYQTKFEICNSNSLKTYITRGNIAVDKYKDGVLTETVTSANINKGLTLAEESDIPTSSESGGISNPVTEDVDFGGFDITNVAEITTTGEVTLGNAVHITGPVDIDNNTFTTNGGAISTVGGSITTTNGNLDLGTGTFTTSGGTITPAANHHIVFSGTTPVNGDYYISFGFNGDRGRLYGVRQGTGDMPIDLNLTGGDLDTNSGAILLGGGNLSLEGGNIRLNLGAGSGGGNILMDNGSISDITNVTFVTDAGGTLNLKGGKIETDGGNIFMNESADTTGGGAISMQGGNIYMNKSGQTTGGGWIEMQGGNLKMNDASGSGGGNVVMDNGNISDATNISAVSFTQNGTSLTNVEKYVLPLGGPFNGIKGGTYTTATITSAGAETTTVYTVPVSTKALMVAANFINDNASSRSVQLFMRRGGVDYHLDNSNNVNAGEISNFGGQMYPLLLAGDSIRATISGSDVHVTIHILSFADTAPIVDFFVTSIAASGTLYTCPSNKRAIVLGNNFQVENNGRIYAYNGTGGGITIKFYHVPSGEAKANKYMISNSGTINDAQTNNANASVMMNEGDTIQYDSTGTGSGRIQAVLIEVDE